VDGAVTGQKHGDRADVADVEAPVAEQATVGPLTGDPAIVGVPTFVVGSVMLGLALINYAPAASFGSRWAGRSCTADPNGRVTAQTGKVRAARYLSIWTG
jgi:hypothetical protein